MEVVTFWIAVAGFLMSALTWLRELLARRERIDLEVIDYIRYDHGKSVQFYLRMRNRSSLPASVASISLSFDNKNWTICVLEPREIGTRPGGYLLVTPLFPISLPPVSFYTAYFEFLSCEDIPLVPGTEVFFQIRTSRGNIKQSVKLGSEENYLHIEY